MTHITELLDDARSNLESANETTDTSISQALSAMSIAASLLALAEMKYWSNE